MNHSQQSRKTIWTTQVDIDHTFDQSNFLTVYRKPEAAIGTQEALMKAIRELVSAFCARHGFSEDSRERFLAEIPAQCAKAVEKYESWENSTPEVERMKACAVWLWTSGRLLEEPGRQPIELCSILNDEIRIDCMETIMPAAQISRALNLFCVNRRPTTRPPNWPTDNCLHRGGSMPKKFRDFFTKGLQYRAPMYIATSREQKVADSFVKETATLSGSGDVTEPVRWVVHLDGKLEKWRCVHVNYIDKADGAYSDEEQEFLFAPYSVFTVRGEPIWQEKPTIANPHVIEVDAAPDNAEFPLDSRVAPWC